MSFVPADNPNRAHTHAQEPPRITFKKKDKGGINLQSAVPQSVMDLEAVTAILKEYRIHSADVFLRCDATVDQFIDVVEGNRKYIPAIYVLNKVRAAWMRLACAREALAGHGW